MALVGVFPDYPWSFLNAIKVLNKAQIKASYNQPLVYAAAIHTITMVLTNLSGPGHVDRRDLPVNGQPVGTIDQYRP